MAITVITDGSVTNDSRPLSWTATLAVGDVVSVRVAAWDSGITFPTPTGTGLTFGSPKISNPGTGSRDAMYTWMTKATSAGSITVTCGAPSASCMHTGVLTVYPAADGYDLAGTPNTLAPASVAQSGSMPGANGNIAEFTVGDWNGGSGAARTYLDSATEDLYSFSSGDSTFYFAHCTLTGATTTIGLSAPAGLGQANIGAVEILVGGAAAPTPSPIPRSYFAPLRNPALQRKRRPKPPAQGIATGPANLSANQSESVTISDTVSRSVTLARSQPEAVTLADAQGRALATARAQSESVALADAVARAAALPRALSDSVTLGDTVSRAATDGRAQSESITLGDADARGLVLARGQSESVTIGDTTSGSTGGNASRSQSESITLADTTARALVQGRAQSESVTASDAVAASGTRSRSQSESVTLSDATVRAVGRFRSQSESVTLGDTTARSTSRGRSIGESVTISDLVARTVQQARSLLEAIVIADAVVAHSSNNDRDVDLRATLTARRLQAELVDRLLTATLEHRRLTAELTD